MAYMIGAGITTITQSTRFVRLPCVQGPAAVFIPILAVVALQFGMSAAFTAMAIGGLISALMAYPFQLWGRLRPLIAHPSIYGPLVMLIGLSLSGTVLKLIIGPQPMKPKKLLHLCSVMIEQSYQNLTHIQKRIKYKLFQSRKKHLCNKA